MSDDMTKEEADLFEREMTLVENEAELHAQEGSLEDMENAFRKQNRALSNLATYVSDQESSLRRRAQAMGSDAVALVEALLDEGDSLETGDLAGADLDEERGVILERRMELYELRVQLVEDREALYEARHAAIENLEASVGGLEEQLLNQEKRISDTLRKLISGASSFSSDDDDGDDDQEGDSAGSTSTTGVTQTERTSDVVPRESFTVIAGEAPARTEASIKAEHERKKIARAKQNKG